MKSRRFLEKLEDGKYLFHGSNKKINILEPRQAYNWISKTKRKKDGRFAVFATDNIDRAIFMALLRDLPGMHGSEYRDGKTILRIDKEKEEAINLAHDLKGYVMVLPKKFFKKSGNDFRAEIPIEPIYKVEVSKKDLPTNLGLIE